MGGQHPTYDYRMAGVGDVVLTRVRRNDARLVFPRGLLGTFLVLSDDEVTAEVAGASDEARYLALPAGSYRVLRRHGGGITEGRVLLARREVHELNPSTMVEARDLPTQAKGGNIEKNLVGAAVQFQSSVLRGTGVFVGAAGPMFLHHFDSLSLGGSVLLSRFDAEDRGYKSDVLRLHPALDLRFTLWQRRSTTLAVGGRAGVPIARQHDAQAQVGWSWGAAYAGTLALESAIAGSLRLLLDVSGGGETFRLNGGVETRPVLGLAMGLGWGF
jgi:hypothetical protein